MNSLSQLVLKATIPGVPDFYQGTEFWDLSLVDPDNRRPVDFAARAAGLEQTGTGIDWRELAAHWRDGRIKLALTQRLLALRQAMPALFNEGDHQSVEVSGEQRDHVVAFTRSRGRQRMLVVVARHFAPLTSGGTQWFSGLRNADLDMDAAALSGFRDALGTMPRPELSGANVAQLFGALPVAVLRSP